jgi:Domain of unknown function (DUF4920)
MKRSLYLALLLALPGWAAEMNLGKPIDVKQTTTIKELLTNPDKYLGKDVRVEGEITAVCQNMACWINIKDGSTPETITVKVNDGEIVFPKDGTGRKVVAQGKLEKLDLTKEQYVAYLQHQAIESHTRIDTSTITAAKPVYRIKGSGAVIQ